MCILIVSSKRSFGCGGTYCKLLRLNGQYIDKTMVSVVIFDHVYNIKKTKIYVTNYAWNIINRFSSLLYSSFHLKKNLMISGIIFA